MIRRMDHRARFRAAYLNNCIDQVNLLNKAPFYLFGQGSRGTLYVGGSITYDEVYKGGDQNFYCPAFGLLYPNGVIYNNFWRNRNALPEWGHNYGSADAAQAKAISIAADAANGDFDQLLEDTGWGGHDLTGVTAGDYLTSGGWQPTPDIIGVCEGVDIYHSTPKEFFAGNGARASVFPEDPGAIGGGPNFVQKSHNAASFKIEGQSAGFSHVLQSLPDGAEVVQALIPVKLSDFTYYWQKDTWDPEYRGHVFEPGVGWLDPWISNAESVNNGTVTTGDVTFTLMGRRNTGTFTNSAGRVRRQTTWDMLGASSSLSVDNNAWVVVDITEMCSTYLTTWRKNHTHFSFAFFPSMGPAPGSSAKEWLAGMPSRPEFEILSNPTWDDGAGVLDAWQHGYSSFPSPSGPGTGLNPQRVYQDYGPFNRERISEVITWGGLEMGEGVIEWKYPSSESGRSVTYSNMVRGDNPVLG